MEEKTQLSIEDLKYIQIIMTTAARLGCFRETDEAEAIQLYNKISKIIKEKHEEKENSSID